MRALIVALMLGLGCVGLAQPLGDPEPLPATRPLTIGDQAPPLRIMRWLKGEPVPRFLPGRVYAIEFWATWCGPCIAGIPHLTEVQRRFQEHADLISVTTEDPGNTLEGVTEFVAARDEEMGYRVAFDEGDATWSAYMKAAGQSGIPCAFVVDKAGRVAWIGHPADPAFERTIEQIIADEYDIDAARALAAAQAARVERLGALQAELHAAWASGEHERALALADEIVALDPEGMSRWAWWKFEALMTGLESPARASTYVRSLRDGAYRDNVEMLLRFTYGIADSLGIEDPDTGLALELAKRAVELTDGQDSRTLAGLAMVHMRRKEYDEGIAAQERAVDLATSPAIRARLQNDLDFYRLDKEFDQGG